MQTDDFRTERLRFIPRSVTYAHEPREFQGHVAAMKFIASAASRRILLRRHEGGFFGSNGGGGGKIR